MQKKHGLPGQPKSISCYSLPNVVHVQTASFPFPATVWAQITTVIGATGLQWQLPHRQYPLVFNNLCPFFTCCFSERQNCTDPDGLGPKRKKPFYYTWNFSLGFFHQWEGCTTSTAGHVSYFSSNSNRVIHWIKSIHIYGAPTMCQALFWKLIPQWAKLRSWPCKAFKGVGWEETDRKSHK